MDLEFYRYVLVRLMNKFYDMSKLDKDKKITFIMGTRKQQLEQRNIELQKRIFDIKWHIEGVVELLEKGNSEKALKLLKKVIYND